jgi:pimeloyl-ACP methyl ester carboxylesterase
VESASARLGLPVEERSVATNGVRLHVVEAGPRDGPLVVLLHGFPEGWWGWRRQIGPLAAAGFRVVVPDQRGYGGSDRPRGFRAYRMEALADDVAGLIEACGRQRAGVVGHDWGGIAAWGAAIRHPDRVQRLAILNVAHPLVMRRALLTSPRQMRRSWYIYFFLLPWLPEWWLRRNRMRVLAAGLWTARRGTFTRDEIEAYRPAWSQPGALTAMLDWYRAALLRRVPPGDGRVDPETLVLWGARDRFQGRELVEPSLARCRQARAIFLEDATHWIQHEEAAAVNELLGRFLTGGLAALAECR